MAQVAGPYGLRIRKLVGDLPFSSGMHTYPLTVNQSGGFFFGDPVGLVAGQPTPLTASPTPTLSNNSPIGIFMGCEYQDPKWGFVNAHFLPASALLLGFTKVRLKIMDWQNLVMQIQADGQVTIDSIGKNAAMVGPWAAGNTAFGNSVVALSASSIGPGPLALRIYDFVYNASPSPGASSRPGDPFTDVLVTWNFGVHRFNNSTGL